MPDGTLLPPFASARFAWVEGLAPGRNQFVSFWQDLERGELIEPVTLNLFADTRYRLWVNRRFVAYGPGRFVTQYPEFDSYELAPFLISGKNRIRVEVNYYGASSFQSMPDGRPGFLASGGPRSQPRLFLTPGTWRAQVHAAWPADAPLFSFAQNPAEICDLPRLEQELTAPGARPVVALPPSAVPWTSPAPRSVPYPDYRRMRPGRMRLAAPCANQRKILGIQLASPGDPGNRVGSSRKKDPKPAHQITAWIHAAADTRLELDTFWSRVELNGQPLELDTGTLQGNHGILKAPLSAGWHFFSANVEVLTEHWSYLLAWPDSDPICFHARPDRACPEPWAVSPVRYDRAVFPCPEKPDTWSLPRGWRLDSGDPGRVTPARMVAMDKPCLDRGHTDRPIGDLPGLQFEDTRTVMWCFDFEDQFYGQPELDVEAPAGTILDVAYDDWLREDGCVNLYGANPFTDAADRYFLRAGRQRIDGLNPRGGQYIQCVFRLPDDSGACRIHDLAIRSRQVLKRVQSPGWFHGDDPDINWAWHTGTHTLIASTDEGYADSPWRERGSYIGDSYVNLGIHRLVTADLSIARRTFRLMGQGQHREGPRQGQLASVTPAWHRYGHDDFTLVWILCLRDYWAMTGDTALSADMVETIKRIWASPVWRENETGLWDVTADQHPFVDWGVTRENRYGPSNLIMNAFRVGALDATADLFGALGQTAEATGFTDQANRVRLSLERELWSDRAGRFRPDAERSDPCLHGQVLALAFGIGNASRILKSITPDLENNLRTGLAGGEHAGHLELYFHQYLLPALARLGETSLAEAFIREHAAFLRSLNRPTLNECFCRAARGAGSGCHSWSGAPASYATAWILGLRQAVPGNPDHWLVDPRTTSVDRASGALPHRDGVIRVSWQRHNHTRQVAVDAPDTVEVTLAPGLVHSTAVSP
ncbi:MAG: hypothetical protein ACFE0O_07345 [Opitutales bacterium]